MCNVQTAVSRAVQSYRSGKMRIDPARMPVIPNGISQPRRPSAGKIRELREEWGVARCTLALGSLGRLEKRKGYDDLLHAVTRLSEGIPEGEQWGLVILGDGPMKQKLTDLAERMPKNITVVLPGFREDGPYCIGAFDLFVMPSRSEGFGLTMSEAMAHGIPILASDIETLRETGGSYLGVEFTDFRGNVEGLLPQILRLLERKRSLAPTILHTEEQMAADYLQLYESLT